MHRGESNDECIYDENILFTASLAKFIQIRNNIAAAVFHSNFKYLHMIAYGFKLNKLSSFYICKLITSPCFSVCIVVLFWPFFRPAHVVYVTPTRILSPGGVACHVPGTRRYQRWRGALTHCDLVTPCDVRNLDHLMSWRRTANHCLNPCWLIFNQNNGKKTFMKF